MPLYKTHCHKAALSLFLLQNLHNDSARKAPNLQGQPVTQRCPHESPKKKNVHIFQARKQCTSQEGHCLGLATGKQGG